MVLGIDKSIRLFNDEEENAPTDHDSLEQRFSGASRLIANYLGLEGTSFPFAGQGGRQAEQGAAGGVGKKREQKRSQGQG